jgi:hypothetical protein
VVDHTLEHLVLIADGERQLDLGILLGERSHQGWDKRLSRGRGSDDLKLACTVAAASSAACRPRCSRPITSAA